jgi:hypothetical protein
MAREEQRSSAESERRRRVELAWRGEAGSVGEAREWARNIGKKEDRQECLSRFDGELASGDRSCVLLDGGEQRIVPEGKRVEKEEAREREGIPHPPCFVQEWQTKDLCLTRSVRVANAGLKVAGFSMICRWLVRVAGKGVTEGEAKEVEGVKEVKEVKETGGCCFACVW